MSFAKAFVLFLSFVVSVNALATPHLHRAVHHHRALAGRVASPEPVDLPAAPIRRRQSSKRCRSRPSSATQSLAPETTHSLPHTHTTTPHAVLAPTTTPQAVPTSTTTSKPPPKPTPTTSKENPPATTQKSSPPPPPSGSSPSYMSGSQTGQGTFYSTGLGACGITNKDTDFIAAVSQQLFDTFPGYNGVNPNNNPVCGRKVTAHYQGKTVTVAITDRCTGCKLTDLDFSPSAFNQLAAFSVGRISDLTWTWDD